MESDLADAGCHPTPPTGVVDLCSRRIPEGWL